MQPEGWGGRVRNNVTGLHLSTDQITYEQHTCGVIVKAWDEVATRASRERTFSRPVILNLLFIAVLFYITDSRETPIAADESESSPVFTGHISGW